jgi:adenylyltransferase/sulfurtransferase
MADILRISTDADEDRFARFRLISWWDQQRLNAARVVVIGAGALGNEILKNLALLGIGRVFVADLDRVANSNLSRSVLFREQDCGSPKVEVAAARAREIYPGMKVQGFFGNVTYDLGLGIYRWADVILGGLDNREARVAINQAAARSGKTWIDGAIERLDGVARVFTPASGPCYECTMSEVDWQMLEARRSCALLSRQEMEQGKTPTTPTTASIIAGIQCQEAVKLLHGLDTLTGQGFVFDGRTHESYRLSYSRLPDCPSHEIFEPVRELDWRASDTQAGKMLELVRSELGPQAVLEFNQDLLAGLSCERCQEFETVRTSLGKVTEDRGRCPRCGEHRAPRIYHSINGQERTILDCTLSELGVPSWDILGGRCGARQVFYEFRGDQETVLGCLAGA